MELKVKEVKRVGFQDSRRNKHHVFIWPEGESLIENLANRRSRPVKEYRAVVNKVLEDHDVDTSKVIVKWSQRAGCGCGCSPGFVVDGWLGTELHRKDIHITVEA